LAPMVGVLAAVPTLLLAAKLSMLAFTLAAAQLEPTLTRIKNQFTELGPVIAKGGLQKGLDYFANSLGGLAKLTGGGLAGLGAEIGNAARATGDVVKSRPFLDQVSAIFVGLRPVVRDVAMGLLALARALLNVVQASLPMVQDMAVTFRMAAEGLQTWTAEQLANGRMAAWLTKAWTIFTRTIGVIVDILIGLFNIFRAGAGYAGDMGTSIERAAYKFRLWTGSAEGQARINQYFQDSLPALREMGKLLGMAVGGLAKLGTNQNVAPLLSQIRTEFAPALGDLVGKLSGQGGLGPALISAATAFVQFFAALNFSGLTLFVQALGALVQGIVWIMQNVPRVQATGAGVRHRLKVRQGVQLGGRGRCRNGEAQCRAEAPGPGLPESRQDILDGRPRNHHGHPGNWRRFHGESSIGRDSSDHRRNRAVVGELRLVPRPGDRRVERHQERRRGRVELDC
jgi:hypothetical protein